MPLPLPLTFLCHCAGCRHLLLPLWVSYINQTTFQMAEIMGVLHASECVKAPAIQLEAGVRGTWHLVGGTYSAACWIWPCCRMFLNILCIVTLVSLYNTAVGKTKGSWLFCSRVLSILLEVTAVSVFVLGEAVCYWSFKLQ